MPAKIVWRDEAQDDLNASIRYIAERSPSAASAYANDLDLAIRGLRDFPLQGRPYDQNYRVLVCRNHLVFYAMEEAAEIITIVAVLDGRRIPPPLLNDR